MRILPVSLIICCLASSAPAQQPRTAPTPPPSPRPPQSSVGGMRIVQPGGAAPSPSLEQTYPRDGRGNPIPQRTTPDPTVPSPAIRELIDGASPREGVAAPAAPKMPQLSIRARVFAKDKPPLAVIDVDGKPLTVRQDSEIFIPGGDGPGLQLKVIELSPTEIKLEVLKRNQFIFLN